MNARLKPLAGYRLSGRRRHGDEGITIVFVALAMVAVLFIAALVIDGGVAYVSHRHSQNEADSGTMAGVRVLEQLKFYPVCSITVPAPCTNFTSTSQIRPVIMQVAQKSDRTIGVLGSGAHVDCGLAGGRFVAVREVEAGDVHPRLQEVAQNRR